MYNGNFRGACDGRRDPWIFINWLYDMDLFFNQIGLSDNKNLRFAKMKLIGRIRDYCYGITVTSERTSLFGKK